MITIKKDRKNQKKVCDPYYLLVYNYMIGDANGNTTEEVEVSLENPYLERYYKLLKSLRPIHGHWGVMLDEYKLKNHLAEEQITENDYEFLIKMMFNKDSKFVVPEENVEFAHEFSDGVRADTEYSFLVFEGLELFYIDEYGKQHETIVK